MYEIIVRVLRVVACHTRLRILLHLARSGEVSPTRLARELDLDLDLVCIHLGKLTSVGLIQRRRSGGWCYCCAKSPYGPQTFSGRLGRWLFNILSDPRTSVKHLGVEQVRDVSVETDVLDVLFEAATAFDNVRRLRVMRLVAERQPLQTDTIAQELSMSPAAAARHTAKLVRRGYLETHRQGRRLVYQLPRQHKTPIHAGLWEIVLTSLTGPEQSHEIARADSAS